MAFDSSTRNRLAGFVKDARDLVTREFAQKFKELYGISENGQIAPLEKLSHLDEMGRATAVLLRERIEYLGRSQPQEKKGLAEAVARLVREQAFTVVNRLAAIRMAEKRGLIPLSVGKGYQSDGFRMYDMVAGKGLGEVYQRYRRYLFCLFDELALEIGILFQRHSPQGLLFPREKALLDLIELLNASDLDSLWAEDETIGWIYQYYNDPLERKKMRDESSAPRNSRELAVRNQFFTPRYVVEFLTDNTLGRIWYEMTQGKTSLKEQCRYLVRRPNEIFFKPGETAPEQPKQDNVSQEDLLKQPVHIPHRPLKDPRTILMLDPACGSMHFGLYAFDLLEVIYDEAWALEEKLGADVLSRPPGMKSLHETYTGKDAFLREVPRLIIENNLHGIDIDPRCAQIAGLSLWLRAQKAWQQLGLKPAERPAIKRSNIVCAEPMPGDKELLRQFVDNKFPVAERAVCLRLLEAIFDKMQLAGEAGSLLKIEEEIRSAIEEAKKKWKAGPKMEQSQLFGGEKLKQQDIPLDYSGLTESEFWNQLEEKIYAALRDYAEQAENGGGFQRRLFAEDAARGFAFIDVCRKRYDVALMNPPFGDPSASTVVYFKKTYIAAKHDLATAFLERCEAQLNAQGQIGSITTRTIYFLSYVGEWREKFMLSKIRLSTFCDLGNGVLDAMVETAMFTASASQLGNFNSLFIKLSDADERPSKLFSQTQSLNSGISAEGLFLCDTATFRAIPKAPFAYWVPDKVRALFSRLPAFETSDRHGHIGALSQDDFRFVRLWWETPPDRIGSGWTAGSNAQWVPYVKGGTYAPYYMDLSCQLAWADDGEELKAYLVAYRQELGFADQWTGQLNSYPLYFKQGLTWSSRPIDQGSFWILPKGCIFRHSAPAIMDKDQESILFDVALLNSTAYRFLLDLLMPRGSTGTASLKYELGYVRSVPIPIVSEADTRRAAAVALSCAKRVMEGCYALEESHCFVRAALVNRTTTLAETFSRFALGEQQAQDGIRVQSQEVDEMFLGYYELSDGIGRKLLAASNIKGVCECTSNLEPFRNDRIEEQNQRLVSYSMGVAFGRWDIRYATGEQAAPELPDPFAPLPVCPPGQLQNEQGLPALPEDVPAAYPVKNIPWDGILVDDPNHPLDIERRVREVIEIIWSGHVGGPTAEAIEQEACEILGVKSLRDYFRKPAGFFADHLKRYSKSRRQAPIYWPLSTASGSYTIWIYYHRLTDQTLHSAIADFLDPKIKATGKAIDEARSKKRGAEIIELSDLLDELNQFREEIERVIKLPWKPNLNDGVLITACPLWRLFRHGKWHKDLKACWEALSEGEYDWAHLAYSIWPDRVRDKCKADRSLAIAHNLEELCKPQDSLKKPKKTKK